VRRRDFIALVGGATTLFPLGGGAQQSERVRRIAVLQVLAEKDPEALERLATFEKALENLGWSKGLRANRCPRGHVSGIECAATRRVETIEVSPIIVAKTTMFLPTCQLSP